ncbi:oleoyl-acyl carrier protein thioesterase 1, chloroplastic-like [Macadamia integrifolia]|uniref:oleoyl-acyl carrier protein thioesterase 1, chloroplastic-like n=1 Tax=Macadamia integrifolia TaxID=60698 RepID=UPI001C4EE89F|nr:oleoyl-acyl carrier protein thioesterase 1, chloroplastic-like [Macadamia integrifolia]XP_042517373.1 oleoyl-acyl carrier protein thioesterase 1, chloroplastic-like [Macadamia integrifolia]
MSLKGCTAPDQLRTVIQSRSLAAPKVLTHRGIAVVSCCSAPSVSTPLTASQTSINPTNVSAPAKASGASLRYSHTDRRFLSLVDQFRLGGMAEDGFSYKRRFRVRSCEVGPNKTATIGAIAILLQEVSCNHVQSLGYTDGFGRSYTMMQLHLIWVITRMHIEVYKYPTWGDAIEIETWYEGGRVGNRRDWIIKDAAGTVIGRATSKWVMMNQDTRRVHKVSDEVLDEILSYCPRTPRLSFPEEDNSSLKKIPKLKEPAQYSRLELKPRTADLDMNQHINNVTYIAWILESMPQEVIDNYEIQKITLDYRRECLHDDMVDSLTSMEQMEGAEADLELKVTNGSATGNKHEEDCCQFLHFMRLSGGRPELNRGRTEWRRIPTR